MYVHSCQVLRGCKLCISSLKTLRSCLSTITMFMLWETVWVSAHRLMPGQTLAAVIAAVRRRALKARRDPAKQAALQQWLFAFTRHVAHGLSQVGSCPCSFRYPGEHPVCTVLCCTANHVPVVQSSGLCGQPVFMKCAAVQRASRGCCNLALVTKANTVVCCTGPG